jgi:hypothetical protein
MPGIVVFAVLAVIFVAVAWLDYGRNKEVASKRCQHSYLALHRQTSVSLFARLP